MTRICVFCGSSQGARPEYDRAARALGEALASRRIGLVYGGAGMGTMASLASAVLEGGGAVTGVMPRDLVEREIADRKVRDLRIVGSMHERKALMAGLSDAFIALPGGLGTLDELSEVLSLAELGRHPKPVGLLNVCRYFDALLAFLDHAVAERFVGATQLSRLLVEENHDALLDRLAAAARAV
jgi:uncharacterized protein (TIGR00730 family)